MIIPHRSIAPTFLICLGLLCGASTSAAQQPSGKRLLFIGNSLTYSNDLPALVSALFEAGKQPKPQVETILAGGASLGDHWKNEQIGSKIRKGPWDYVILQQGPSSLASSQKEFMQDMEAAKPWFKESKAKAALYMVWPDNRRLAYFPQVRQAYVNAAKSVDGVFLPAGVAWQKALALDKSLPLFSGDGFHPSPEGTYLAGMVIASKLSGVSPEAFPSQLSWSNGFAVKLTAAQHATMVKAATEALKDEGK